MSINKLLLRVYVFSHNFLVTDIGARGRELCFSFSKDLVQYTWENVAGQYHKVPAKVFASATQDRSQFRFHINLFENFESFLLRNDIKGDLVEFIKVPVSEGVDVEFVVKPNWIARPDQLPVVDYLYKEKPVSKFVDLQTGKGKSFLAMLAIANRAKRVCIIIKPAYIKKWVQDFCKTYEIHQSEILVIQGSASLMALLDMAKNGTLDCKAIILSNKTMQNWLSTYQEHKDDTLEAGYACRPHSFFEFVGVGLRLIDEVHQDFHLNFKIDLNTNVKESISLSATLLSNDPFIEKMYEIAYPLANRFRGLALDKYIDSYAIHYRLSLIHI
jgi:superfamily II DNA or RNA helicase